MEHSKLIGSAAYLKIISNQEEGAIMGMVILAEGYSGELFYNQYDGIAIINEYLDNKIISEEEYIYLCYLIYNSRLTEEPIDEVDEGLSYVRGHIDSLKNHCTRDYIIDNTKENFPTYPPEVINCLFEESIIKENNNRLTIN